LKVDKQVKTHEAHCRSRLISLVNEVLRHTETPPEGTSELEMLLILCRRFFEATLSAPETDTPKEWEGTFMFSTPVDASRLH
jgi:hypothetical protein